MYVAHVWNAFEDEVDQNTANVVMHDLLAWSFACLKDVCPITPFRPNKMLPWRKLIEIRLVLNLCPSHTEIFSKRRKIYSWMYERLELMRQPLKNFPTSRTLGNAFDLDFEFHYVNGLEIEARWGRTLVEDNCNNFTQAKVAEIARMPYNPLVV